MLALEHQEVARAGLVGHWALDRDSVNLAGALARDRSGLGNHAAITSAPSFDRGKIKDALLFQPGEYCSIAAPVGFSFGTGVSFCFWMKASAAPAAVAYRHLILIGATASFMSFSWDHTSGGYQQGVTLGETGGVFTAAKLTSTLAANVWYHIAGVFDGDALLQAFLNGVVEANTVIAGTPVSTAGATRFTNSQGSTTNNYTLDDVRIYKGALSVAQVRAIYNAGLGGRL